MSEYMNNNAGMDWDDVIENDGQDFILPEGDYNFVVTDFERGRFPGSAKISPCNKATLTLQVKTVTGMVNVYTDLILNRVMEWQLSSFFRCIGQKKHGERLVMNWNKVVGSKGHAHFNLVLITRTVRNVSNNVSKFYDYDEKNFSAEDDWD